MAVHKADVAVIGGGILGLAHAYLAAVAGKSVVVFERNERATGASIRNFGLIWPIGQPAGHMFDMALRSREIWKLVLERARLPYFETGSLHLAYRDDEQAVAEEFAATGPANGYPVSWLSAGETLWRTRGVVAKGLRGALWSASEMMVDPRLVIDQLPALLAEQFGVQLRYGQVVREIDLPVVKTAWASWNVETAIVCTGDDFETLYPLQFRESGIVRCKLQMMRTAPQPDGWLLGPAVAGGLTLRFYASFRACASYHALAHRIALESPEIEKWGIHVMASQTPAGEITIGDSHEYALHVDIFNRADIDELILDYLRTFLTLPKPAVTQRWYGVYAKHPDKPYVRFHPAPGVTVVTAPGGAGMTLSFGLAAETLATMP